MSYWNNLNLQKIGFNPYINNTTGVRFRGNAPTDFGVTLPNDDSFSTKNDKYFLSKSEIEANAKSSETIKELCKQYNIPIKVNIEELEKLKSGHLKNSRVLAAKILSGLPPEMKNQVDSSVLQQAAMFHDYGKVLIPKNILNKETSLNEKEKDIMQLHPTFSYELLKKQGVNEEVLNLIKYHHQTPDGQGYPAFDNNVEYGIPLQILRAADEYAALTENRSYKPAMSKAEALEIIYQDVENGYISQEVFDSLKKNCT